MDLAGETDSEVLFAFLMARLEQPESTKGALASAVDELAGIPSLGAATFLLSDGVTLYAYRHGRPLMLLERRCGERIEAVLVASEPVTDDEPWEPISEQTLIAISRESDRVRVEIVCSAPAVSASARPLHSKGHRQGAP
jgi:predicted glutamine amidotransferase